MQEQQHELEDENVWLMSGDPVQVFALDDHAAHFAMHTRLLAATWLRNSKLAEKLGKTNAPQILQNVMQHIQEHTQYLAGASANTAAVSAQPPLAQVTQRQPGLGQLPHADDRPMPQSSPDVPDSNNVQQQSAGLHIAMPNQPGQPQMPHKSVFT